MTNKRIIITGDIHANIDISKLKNDRVKHTTNLDLFDISFLIILGDFGLFWERTQSKEEKYWLDWLSDKPYQTLFLDGNHENFNRLSNLESVQISQHNFKGEVGYYNEKIWHLKRSNFYEIENRGFLVLGGAESIDKSRRVENISWWPQESITDEDINKTIHVFKENIDKIDYILSHTCPINELFRILPYMKTKPEFQSSSYKLQLLHDAVLGSNSNKLKKWFYGHMHVDTQQEPEYLFQGLYNDLVVI